MAPGDGGRPPIENGNALTVSAMLDGGEVEISRLFRAGLVVGRRHGFFAFYIDQTWRGLETR